MEAERTERRGAIQWVKEHKTVLIAIGIGAIGIFFVAKTGTQSRDFSRQANQLLAPSKKRQQL